MAWPPERLPATIGMDGADERARPIFGNETSLGTVEMERARLQRVKSMSRICAVDIKITRSLAEVKPNAKPMSR